MNLEIQWTDTDMSGKCILRSSNEVENHTATQSLGDKCSLKKKGKCKDTEAEVSYSWARRRLCANGVTTDGGIVKWGQNCV